MVKIGDIVLISGGGAVTAPAIVTAVPTSQTISATAFPDGMATGLTFAYVPHQTQALGGGICWRHLVEDPR